MVQRRKSTAVRKQQIIDAARKLIMRKGSEHLTVRSMAKEVGLTEAAIYRHFKSKREILSFLMNNIMDTMLHDVERTTVENSPSLETIDQVLKHHLSEIEQRKGMSFQIIAEIISLGDKKLNKDVYEKLNLYIGRLENLLSEGARGGHIRDGIDFGASALLLFGMIQGLANIWALSGYSFDLSAKYESLWAIYQKAVKPRKANEPG
ncbi:MAG: TetR/AcrR family transcriptional regulator [Desulfobacterales bacterium]|jgi:AcrR family transcriptional regulator|nr:TetR/AcrR family transcriptional regulator [Desulfobacterales bacterium]